MVVKLAERFGLRSAWIRSASDGDTVNSSEWMLLSRQNALVAGLAGTMDGASQPEVRLWTDDYSNLFQVLRK